MKNILSLFLVLFFGFFNAQNLKPIPQEIANLHAKNTTFKRYSIFERNTDAALLNEFKKSATDISVLNLKSQDLKSLLESRPQFLEISFPYANGKEITVELYKNEIYTSDFKVTTDKGASSYKQGVFYRGIVKGDYQSIVSFSFFDNEVMGMASIKNIGNIIVGKALNSDKFVSYTDSTLTGKNNFVCEADELIENNKQKISYTPDMASKMMTTNCVRIYYEMCYKTYQNNGANVTTTTNWISGVHNQISTLYANDGIKIALFEVFVWTTADPYTGTPQANLSSFRNNRQTFNGDLAHLVNSPSTTSVAYVNSLCTTYKHAYSGISQSYSQVPVYSWTIQAMTHEMGHSLGSPHTHACAWNGDNSAIDGCGPAANYSEGCDAPLPPAGGGTIMSYCHLVGAVGINFANGFGEQPAALIRNTVDSKGCLGTNCTTACSNTVSGLSISGVSQNSANATITDNVSTSWTYQLKKFDGTIITTGTSTNKNLSFSGLQPNTYFILGIGNGCSAPSAYQASDFFLTDTDWCANPTFTDTGGTTGNYLDNQYFVKTFYPSGAGGKLVLTFTEFGLEPKDPQTGQIYDYMTVYNGPSTASPVFANGSQLNGNTVPGPFTSTHSTGAITVVFSSDPGVTGSGWKATFSCLNLGVNDVKDGDFGIFPNPAKTKVSINAKDNVKSYQILDASGRIVLSEKVVDKKNFDINVSGLAKGVYMISLKSENSTATKKLIKE